jgi:protein-S-isoprenylcysteine O-methyltransferase Ste14
MVLFLKNLAFTIIAPGTAAFLIPWLIVGGRLTELGLMTLVSTLLFILGAAIYLWCVWDFATFGRGTPAPIDAPKKLVVRGLYQYSRNPMYLGVLILILAWAASFKAIILLVYMLIVGLAFHTFVILYEEPHLRKLFGESYFNYCARVPRWLPRLRTK